MKTNNLSNQSFGICAAHLAKSKYLFQSNKPQALFVELGNTIEKSKFNFKLAPLPIVDEAVITKKQSINPIFTYIAHLFD